MMVDVNETYCGYPTICTNTKSLCCIPEMNIMLYLNYTSLKKKEQTRLQVLLSSIVKGVGNSSYPI